jgi:hypothetical protein
MAVGLKQCVMKRGPRIMITLHRTDNQELKKDGCLG